MMFSMSPYGGTNAGDGKGTPSSSRKRLQYSSSSADSGTDAEPMSAGGENKKLPKGYDSPVFANTFNKRMRITLNETSGKCTETATANVRAEEKKELPAAVTNAPPPPLSSSSDTQSPLDTPPHSDHSKTIKITRDDLHTELLNTCSEDARRAFLTSSGYEFAKLPASLVRAETAHDIADHLNDTLLHMLRDDDLKESNYVKCVRLHARLINTMAAVRKFCDAYDEHLEKKKK